MKKKSRFKIVDLLIGILFVVLICFCAYILQPEIKRTQQVWAELRRLKWQKALEETEIAELEHDIANMELPEYIEKAAREELGLVRPDEKVYIFEESN